MASKLLRRSLKIGLAAVIVLPLGLILVAWLLARASLPEIEGEVTVAGLDAPAEILRDEDGIVTIRAGSRRDAAFALGFAHAQDRLWQMDFTRRTGAGRLSEVVGAATLRFDRMLRTLGLYRVAEKNLEVVSDRTRALLEAYSAGVNAFIEGHEGPWPPEFLLLRYTPEPWTAVDSLVWGRLMALQLSGNFRDELLRAGLKEAVTPEELELLFPPYPSDGPVSFAKTGGLFPTEDTQGRRLTEILPWSLMPKKASNSWALSGDRTATGAPILANDPHLGLGAPGTWYLARIETPEGVAAGVTAPGVPFMVIGHNGHIAWGFTTTHSDTQDLFIEQLSEGQPEHYDTPDGPRPFETREETIEVRGEEPEKLVVRTTRHGPVISDVVPEAEDFLSEGEVMALAWPALAEDDRTGDALAGLSEARDWDGFLAAMRNFHSPQQNVIYADTSGSIGMVVPARVPMRRGGDGSLPVPGWTGTHDWTGWVPFEELPLTLNPGSGRIVAANNRSAGPDYPHILTAHWAFPHRAERIIERLSSLKQATLDDNHSIQVDIVSMAAERLLPRLLAALPDGKDDDDLVGRARTLLSDWDRRMDRERPEPLIFASWIETLNRGLLAPRLGERAEDFARPNPARLAGILERGEWCDDPASDAEESCEERIGTALSEALAELAEHFGGDLDDWRWGEAHVARLAHPIFGRIPVLRDLLGKPVETHGGAITVNRGGASFQGELERRFEHVHGPGLRVVYDLSDLDNSRFIIATGQSGHIFSPNYLDLAPLWADGQSLTLGPAGNASRKLTLSPG